MTRKEYYEYLKTLKGEKNHFFGHNHSIDAREKMSLAKLGKPSTQKRRVLPICKCGKQMSDEKSKKCRACWLKDKVNRIGSKSPSWQGGIHALQTYIRELTEYSIWRKQIFERDNYTCIECHERGGNIHAHHKKAFSIIFREFINKYNIFSPTEDKETLIRLSLMYKPFLEISNGVTLCENCHSKYTTRPNVKLGEK